MKGSAVVVYQFFGLMIVASIVAMAVRFIRLPYTIALVLTGLLVGWTGIFPDVRLEPGMLFTLFLPPLLFEAGIHIDTKLLRRDGVVIAVLAIVGTVICAGLVAIVVHYVIGVDWIVAFLIGAVISPTDPISVVAMFRQLGVNKRLTTIVEAESLFNDGVAVVLFSVVAAIMADGRFSPATSLTKFVVEMGGGIVVGGLVGVLTTLVTKRFNDHLLEITITTIVAWGAYIVADSLHTSGVVAVVVASIVTGRWLIRRGMSENSRVAVESFWEYIAFAVNSIVFLLIGIQMFHMEWTGQIMVVLAAILALLCGRTLSVVGCVALLKKTGQGMPWSWQGVLIWGGLRGSLSMAMALGATFAGNNQALVIVMTFGAVLFSLLAQGLTIDRLVIRLGLAKKKAN